MNNIYTNGQYLEFTKTWHSEDARWKAGQILKMLRRNRLIPARVGEVGCGAGAVLSELALQADFVKTLFMGYDISPQAIAMAKQISNNKVWYFCEDLLAAENQALFDLLLVMDVVEHIPDYLGFLDKCRQKAAYKIYHFPLDVHVSSVLRNTILSARRSVGHLHYFTADSVVAALQDTGHEVLDFFYTDGALALFRRHPSFKCAVANIPRWLLAKISLPFTARLLGGYSLLVLTK